MKKLIGPFAKVGGAFFALAVGVIMVSLSYSALGVIFPNSLFDQAAGLVLFDVACVLCFLTFVGNSHSVGQYVFSGLGFLLGLLGTLGLIAIEVGISSGMWVAAEMARPLTYIFVAAAIGHLVLLYLFHGSAPEVSSKISMGVERAKILADAERQAEQMLMDNQSVLAGPIANEHVREILNQLNLRPRGEVVDASALDVNALAVRPVEAPASGGAANFLAKILSGLGVGGRKYESSVPNVVSGSLQPTKPPSPAQDVVEPGAGVDSKPNK